MRLPARPTIYEVNTAVWLGELSRRAGTRITLSEVPSDEWDRLAALHVDAIWLMGVWQRSPAGLEIARRHPELMSSFRQALPDLQDDDVIGSPYCVREYVLEPRFGEPEALRVARAALASRGISLILDYVPNHVAPDHRWVEHADYFIRGPASKLEAPPAGFLDTADGVLANGKDPYLGPWPDVVQLNAFSLGVREAAIDTLLSIGQHCDGVRCDMAMLMTNDVFARTWGDRAGSPPVDDYWPTIIGSVREARPALVFIAEAYWDMEWTLQQQGFDMCLDKRLYDRLVGDSTQSIRAHLEAPSEYQESLVRFIENHDEPRAADTFAPPKQRAAAVVMSTLQGARLYHSGQLEGLRTRIPVFLARGPQQPRNEELRVFYGKLLRAVADSDLRSGDWRLCECTGWPDNATSEQLLAWCWGPRSGRAQEAGHLIVVNFGPQAAQGRVRLPWRDLAGCEWHLFDALNDDSFNRHGRELQDEGLYVAMAPWESYFLKFQVKTCRGCPEQ